MRGDGPVSAWWDFIILSRLAGLGSIVSSPSGVWGGVRNSVRFYVCFSALWKLWIPKVGLQENVTVVGKVTLHLWSSTRGSGRGSSK